MRHDFRGQACPDIRTAKAPVTPVLGPSSCSEVAVREPSIGHIVHYVAAPQAAQAMLQPAPRCCAAIVTDVHGQRLPDADAPIEDQPWYVDLTVFNATAMSFERCDQSEDDRTVGTWHWPEQV